MTSNKTILLSGAGIAGLCAAYWLRKFEFEPTIVEKRPDLNAEGYMIDFYGSGFDVAEKMGLIEPLRARHNPIPLLEFVDKRGKVRSALNVERFRKLLGFRHFNFMRGDLAAVLYEAVKDFVPVRFNTSISQIHQDVQSVTVELSDGTRSEYDMVIGADGIHSNVRNLLWGGHNQFENFLGYYVVCGVVENFLNEPDAFYCHVEPKRQVSVYAIRGNRLATFFAFQSEQRDIRERRQQHEILTQVFGDMGWIVPELVEQTKRSGQFYFDSVAQVSLTPWYKGRIVLLGDACQCLTLLAGQGASMAMAGAYRLAEELRQSHGEHETAFQAYQYQLKPEIDERQQQARKLASSFVPNSRLSIWMMYLFLKVAFWPGFRSLFLKQIGSQSIIK